MRWVIERSDGKRHGALWLLLAAVFSLLSTACASSAQPAATTQPPNGSPTVNRLVMAVAAPRAETNDPRTERGPTNWQFRPFYEYLVGVNTQTGKYEPQLATDWKLEPDGRSFRFTLRKDVKFHNSKGDWNADALIDAWKAQVSNPDVNNYPLIDALIQDIEKVGPYEAIVHLKSPDGTFMLTISEQRGVFYMLNGKDLMAKGTPDFQTGPAAGTGPYQFKERTQGQNIVYERVPYQHWRVTPDFPEFEYRFIKENSSRLAALLTHEVHLADLPVDLQKQAVEKGYKLIPGQVQGERAFVKFYCCHMKNYKDPNSGWTHPESPLADVRVRKALSKAIDRDELNKAFFDGDGEMMYLAHFNPNRPGWNPDWQENFPAEYGYDPAAAKQLLAEAGYSPTGPLETNMIFPSEGYGFAGGDDVQDAIATMWGAVGVKVNYETLEAAERRRLTDAQELWNHTVLGGTSSDIWTGRTTYGSAQGTARGVGMEIPEADAKLGEIRHTLDEEKQDALWRQVGQIDYDQHREIPLFWVPIKATVDPKVVAGWDYPGAITGAWTHVFNIIAVKQ